MTLYQAQDLLNAQLTFIGATWSMFIGLHLAAIGGLVIVRRQISWFEKSAIIGAYSLFMILNALSQLDNYVYLEALIQATQLATETNVAIKETLTQSMSGTAWFKDWVLVFYGLCWSAMIAFIVVVNRFSISARRRA